MRSSLSSKFLTSIASLFLLSSLCIPASAQNSDKPAPPPPKMDKLEEGIDPNLKGSSNPVIKQEPDRKITERKVNGKVVEATVKSGKSTYTLNPKTDAHDHTQHGDVQSGPAKGAQWKIMEFGGDKKPTEGSTPPAKKAENKSENKSTNSASGK